MHSHDFYVRLITYSPSFSLNLVCVASELQLNSHILKAVGELELDIQNISWGAALRIQRHDDLSSRLLEFKLGVREEVIWHSVFKSPMMMEEVTAGDELRRQTLTWITCACNFLVPQTLFCPAPHVWNETHGPVSID